MSPANAAFFGHRDGPVVSPVAVLPKGLRLLKR